MPKAVDVADGDYIIRMLTPEECERLQTWPTGYTDCVSKTQRYKIIGNGWTAEVIVYLLGFLRVVLGAGHEEED